MGFGAVRRSPAVVEGQLAVRPIVHASLSGDHCQQGRYIGAPSGVIKAQPAQKLGSCPQWGEAGNHLPTRNSLREATCVKQLQLLLVGFDRWRISVCSKQVGGTPSAPHDIGGAGSDLGFEQLEAALRGRVKRLRLSKLGRKLVKEPHEVSFDR